MFLFSKVFVSDKRKQNIGCIIETCSISNILVSYSNVYQPMTVLKGHPILKSLEARDSGRNKKNVSSETLGQTFWLSLGQ